jgi:hypothetical protein
MARPAGDIGQIAESADAVTDGGQEVYVPGSTPVYLKVVVVQQNNSTSEATSETASDATSETTAETSSEAPGAPASNGSPEEDRATIRSKVVIAITTAVVALVPLVAMLITDPGNETPRRTSPTQATTAEVTQTQARPDGNVAASPRPPATGTADAPSSEQGTPSLPTTTATSPESTSITTTTTTATTTTTPTEKEETTTGSPTSNPTNPSTENRENTLIDRVITDSSTAFQIAIDVVARQP